MRHHFSTGIVMKPCSSQNKAVLVALFVLFVSPSLSCEQSKRFSAPSKNIGKQSSPHVTGTAKTIGVPFASAKMVWISKGSFKVSAPINQGNSSEKRLTIHKGFWMWQMEVTQGQYKALTGENPAHFKKCGLKCPVESVSWSEVAQFANKLSKAQRLETCFLDDGSRLKPQFRKGRAYNTCKGWRLPTELEWKYTVRAGRNAGTANKTSLVQEKPVPVASSPPNLWGLYDIDGNVNEWTLDWGQSRGSNGWNRMLSNCFRVKTGDGRHLPNRRVPPCKIKFNLSSRVPSLGFRLVRSL